MTVQTQTKWPSAPQQGRTRCQESGHLFTQINLNDFKEVAKSIQPCGRGSRALEKLKRLAKFKRGSNISTKTLFDNLFDLTGEYQPFHMTEILHAIRNLNTILYAKLRKDFLVYTGMYLFPKFFGDLEYYNNLSQVKKDLDESLSDTVLKTPYDKKYELIYRMHSHLDNFLDTYRLPSSKVELWNDQFRYIGVGGLIHISDPFVRVQTEALIISVTGYTLINAGIYTYWPISSIPLKDIYLAYARVWNRFFLALGYPKPDDIIL